MRKVIIVFFFLIICCFSFFTKVEAHTPGQPPFFKVNGVYSDLYLVQSTSLEDFELPQDSSSEVYLVNQKIQFKIDTQALQVPDAIIDQTEFTWDYGDSEKGTGLENEHAYKKSGSFILKIYARTKQDVSPQLFQSVVLNIVPSKEYKLSKSIIKVNDWVTKDPVSDVAKVEFGETIGFDASLSTTTSEITEYFWDFGDGQTATGPKVTHVYDKDLIVVFPLLRIKDKDGFFSDTFVQLNNADLTSNEVGAHSIGKYGNVGNSDKLKLLIPSAFILLIFIGFIIFSKIKGKK
jgi:hypothetical protein